MIYVGKREYKYGRMYMSYMIADSLEELHRMADSLEVDRKHFQDKEGKPHYDICRENKRKAIELGAKLIDDREIVKKLNKFRVRNVK